MFNLFLNHENRLLDNIEGKKGDKRGYETPLIVSKEQLSFFIFESWIRNSTASFMIPCRSTVYIYTENR